MITGAYDPSHQVAGAAFSNAAILCRSDLISSKRAVLSRMIEAIPTAVPSSSSSITIVNSTEIRLPSFVTAGTDSRSP
jgi:hypothetical protein